MKIRELILNPDGLLKPEIQSAQFERIYYGALARAIGIPGEFGYSPVLDERIKAHLVYGSVINAHTFIFRGTIVYTLEGEPVALSWKNCGACPTRVAFLEEGPVEALYSLLLRTCFSLPDSLNIVTLDSQFEPKR